MDQTTLIKIARLRTLAARKGKAFDVVRFVGDRPYANQVLTDVMDTDEEDVLVLGLQLMQLMGLGAGPTPNEAAASPSTARAERGAVAVSKAESAAPGKTERYIGRLR